MTRPVAKASVQVVGDVPAKFVNDLSRDLNKAVQGIRVDASPIADGIAKGAKDGATQADRAFDHLADQLGTTFAEIGHDADRAFDHVSSDAAAAGEKVGHRFKAAGEVSERALQELDRTAGREFASIANKAGASAAATSTKWVAAWSVIKGAALAATAASVAGLTAITAFGLKSAAALEQTAIGLTSLLGSADAAASFIKELQTFAAATPFAFADVADASRRILAFGSSVGIARKEVIPTLTTIGDLVAVLGGTSESVNSVIRALGQMASKGKVSQEEILQLAEALPGFNANAAIAASLGLSVADTLKLITAGGVSAKVGIDALLKGMGQFPGAAGAMAAQAQTLSGVFSTFKDTIAIALTDAFTPVIPQIKESLTQLTPIFGQAITVLAPILGQFLSGILPIIGQLATAVAPLLGVFVSLASTLLAAFAPALAQLAPIVQRLLEGLQPLALTIGQALAKALIALIDSGALDEIVTQLLDLVPAVIDLLIALTPLLPTIAELAVLFLRMQRPGIQLLALVVSLLSSKALGPILGVVADAVGRLFHTFDEASSVVTDISNWPHMISAMASKVGDLFSGLSQTISGFFSDIGHWFSELPGKIGGFLSSLPGLIAGALLAALDAVTHGIGVIIGAFLAFPFLAVQALIALPGLLVDFFTNLWTTVKTAVSAGWDALVTLADEFPARMLAGLQVLGALIGGAFSSALEAAKNFVVNGFNSIVDFAKSVPDRIAALAGLMLSAGLAMIRGLFDGLGQAGGFVGDLAGKITSAIKGLLNKVISGINSGIASVDDALPGISLPRIPQLASGGLTTAGGLASLHPRELVLPLEDQRAVNLLARAMSAAAAPSSQAAALAGDGGPGSIEVHVFIGETELTDMVNVVVRERDRKTKARVKAGAGVRRR